MATKIVKAGKPREWKEQIAVSAVSCVVSEIIPAEDDTRLPERLQKLDLSDLYVIRLAHRLQCNVRNAMISNPNNVVSAILRFSKVILGAKTTNNDFFYVDGELYRRTSQKELGIRKVGQGLKWTRDKQLCYLARRVGKLSNKAISKLDEIVLLKYEDSVNEKVPTKFPLRVPIPNAWNMDPECLTIQKN